MTAATPSDPTELRLRMRKEQSHCEEQRCRTEGSAPARAWGGLRSPPSRSAFCIHRVRESPEDSEQPLRRQRAQEVRFLSIVSSETGSGCSDSGSVK